jgi:hypothetical protein
MKWLERIPEEHREPVAVLLVSISVFIWGAILTLFLAGDMAETYTSEARLLVRESPKEALSFGADQDVKRPSTRGNEYLQIQLGILNSTDVRERVARRLLEDSDIPDIAPASSHESRGPSVLAGSPDSAMAALMVRLQMRFQGTIERNSPLIVMKSTWRSRIGAQELLQHYIDAFRAARREFYSMETTVRASGAAVNSAEQRLVRHRQALSDFLEPHAVIDLTKDLLSVRQNFDAQRRTLDNARINIASKQKQLEWWTDFLEELPRVIEEPSTTQVDHRRQSLVSSLDEAREKLATTPYLPGTPTHIRLSDQERRIQESITNLPSEPAQNNVLRANPALSEAQSSMRSLSGDLASLEMIVALGEQRLGSLEIEVNRLARLREDATPLLNAVELAERAATERREEFIRVSAASEALLVETETSHRLVQTPSLPAGPNQIGLLTANTKVGFFLAALAALLAGFVTKIRLPRRI